MFFVISRPYAQMRRTGDAASGSSSKKQLKRGGSSWQSKGNISTMFRIRASPGATISRGKVSPSRLVRIKSGRPIANRRGHMKTPAASIRRCRLRGKPRREKRPVQGARCVRAIPVRAGVGATRTPVLEREDTEAPGVSPDRLCRHEGASPVRSS